MQRKVFIAVPCKYGSARFEFVGSLSAEISSLDANGIPWLLRTWIGDSFIQRARNGLIGMFVDTDATDFVFIDDDIGWPQGAVQRLLDHPVDVVGATYRAKTDESIGYPLRQLGWETKTKIKDPDPETGLIEVDAIGTGFLRFSRLAIEQMIESRKDEWFTAKGVKCWDLCNVKRLPNHGDYEGEDYDLCKTARAAGLKVWLDPHLRMLHVGEKVFEGCVWEDLQKATVKPVEGGPRAVRQRVEEALRAVV